MTFWEMAYGWGWASKEQLRTVTELGELTKEDFERITGEPFDPVPEFLTEPEPKKK